MSKTTWTKEDIKTERTKFEAESAGLPPELVSAINKFFDLLNRYFEDSGKSEATRDELNAYLKANGSDVSLK